MGRGRKERTLAIYLMMLKQDVKKFKLGYASSLGTGMKVISHLSLIDTGLASHDAFLYECLCA